MSKIGVFICHCGENISATVDCEKVAEAAKEMEGVAYAIDYKYMCSDPGQTLIKNAIKEYGLDGVVVAACSPRMHEPTFRRACAEAGLNPYLCEIANIREHCSWVHEKGEATTRKAVDIVKSLVEKVKRNSGKSGHRQLRTSGHSGRERTVHRRTHVTAFGNFSYIRLFAVYSYSPNGGSSAASEYHSLYVCRTGACGRLYR